MSYVKLSRKDCKHLYKYYYDAGNRFACSGVWDMDTAVLFISYNEKIRKNAKYEFQRIKNFRIVYENDANFRYLISRLFKLDKE